MGRNMFCLTFRLGLLRFREDFEREAGIFAHMNDVFLGLMRVTSNTARAFFPLRRELDDIVIVVNPRQDSGTTERARPDDRGNFTTGKRFRPHCRRRWGVTVVGIRIGTYEYMLERAMEVVEDGGVDHLARSLANRPNTKWRLSSSCIAIEPLGQKTIYLEWLGTRSCPSKLGGDQTELGDSVHTRKSLSCRF